MLNMDIWMTLVCGSIVWGALWSLVRISLRIREIGK